MQLISTSLILFTTTPYYLIVSLISFYILCFIKNDRQVKVYYVILEKNHVAYLNKKSAIALGYDPNDIKTNPVPKFVEDVQSNRKINFKFFFRGVPLKVITGIITAATTTMFFMFFGSSTSIDFVGPLILAGVVPAILISMLFWLKESDKKVLYSISYSFLMVFVLLNTSALINSSNNNANFPYLLATISNVLALFTVFAYTFLCGKQKKATLTNIITFSLTALFTLYFTLCNFTMEAFVSELMFAYTGMSIVMPLSLFVLSLSHEDKLYAKSLFW